MNRKYSERDTKNIQTLHAETLELFGSMRSCQASIMEALVRNIKAQGFLILGYSSLFDYLMKEFDLTRATAWRYSSAAYLIREFPEQLQALREGKAALSTLAELRGTLQAARRQGKASPKIHLNENTSSKRGMPSRPVAEHFPELKTREEEKSFVASIARLPLEQAAEKLMELRPPKTSVRRVTHSAQGVHMHLVLSAEEEKLLMRLREVWGHKVEKGDWAGLIVKAIDFALEREDPIRRHERRKEKIAHKVESVESPLPLRREKSLPVKVRDEVMARDEGACQFVKSDGGKCLSKEFVDIDHIVPKARGGTDTVNNLRCLCSQHNRSMRDRAEIKRVGVSSRDPPL